MSDTLMVPLPEHPARKCFTCNDQALVVAFGPVVSIPACADHGLAAKRKADSTK